MPIFDLQLSPEEIYAELSDCEKKDLIKMMKDDGLPADFKNLEIKTLEDEMKLDLIIENFHKFTLPQLENKFNS